ncbi:MAG: DUF1549 domain-containing protein [Zavarzinella sp.]
MKILRKILAASVLTTLLVTLFSIGQQESFAQVDKAKAKQKKQAKNNKAPMKEDPNATIGTSGTLLTKITPPNSPVQPTAVATVARKLDALINQKLAEEGIQPSEKTTDEEFLRRVYLDITGVIPTGQQAEEFLSDASSNKRSVLIDKLLANENFGRHLADYWARLMYPLETDNRFLQKQPLNDWMKASFNKPVPKWDSIAYELITATGEQKTNGAATYLLANRGVDKMTDSVGKMFLGIQVACAQCHNHPFAEIKQDDYWGMAQFFYKVAPVIQRNNKDTNASPGLQEVTDTRISRRTNPLPEAAKSVNPSLLGYGNVRMLQSEPYRPALGKWITSPNNKYFAEAFINRMWEQYFGVGFFKTMDGQMWDENDPSNPKLLSEISTEFKKSGFDVKHLVRCICNTEAYQRSCRTIDSNKLDDRFFSHMNVKVLTGEELFDSFEKVLGETAKAAAAKRKNQVVRGGPQGLRDQFALFYMGSEEGKPVDYEAGIPQALRLMNSNLMAANRLALAANTIAGDSVRNGQVDVAKATEKLYLAALSRRPKPNEVARLEQFIKSHENPRMALGDVLWAIVNTSEFALNH